MLSMSLKCAVEDWIKHMRTHGGRHMLSVVQVDGCVFVSGAGDVGHLLMCQGGRALRVEHTAVTAVDDHAFVMTYVDVSREGAGL